MMKPYNYMFLQYRHDVLSGEFMNIGLVYYSNQDGFLRFRITENLERLKKAFGIIDLSFVKTTIKGVEKAFLALDCSGNFPPKKTIENLAKQALAHDDGSFIWSKPFYGVALDHETMFEDLFARFITQYNDNEKNKHARRNDSRCEGGVMNDVVAKFDADLFHIAYAFTSREETRFYLCGVLIEPHPEQGVLLVASDGYQLIVIHDEDGFAKEKIIVRMDKNPLSLCRKKKTDKDPWTETYDKRAVEILPDGTAFVLLEGKRIGVQEDAIIDGTFPKWRAILPTGITKQPTLTGYDGCLLGKFSVAAKRLTGKGNLFFAAGKNEPFVINFSGQAKAFGVMGPIVTDEQFVGLPDFIKKNDEAA